MSLTTGKCRGKKGLKINSFTSINSFEKMCILSTNFGATFTPGCQKGVKSEAIKRLKGQRSQKKNDAESFK